MQALRLGKPRSASYHVAMAKEILDLDGDGARVLYALADGRGFTTREVAYRARLAPEAAGKWLADFDGRGWLRTYVHGPHRYFAIGDEVTRGALERRLAEADGPLPSLRRLTPRIAPGLRAGRTCYGHLAGVLGVAVTEALLRHGHLLAGDDAFELTDTGRRFLEDRLGVALGAARRSGPAFARRCLDRTQRRPHLGGALGRGLAERCFEAGWIQQTEGRGVRVTPEGRLAFAARLGLELPEAVLL
jgi:hypothetical protein